MSSVLLFPFIVLKWILKKKSQKRTILTNSNLAILGFVLIAWLPIYLLFKFQDISSSDNSLKTDCQNCNVVLIVIDTLRQDHLTPYGYNKNTTPYLDEFSKQSIIFTNNYSASNWTLPAIASMFTGVYPQHHLINNKYLYNHTEIDVSLNSLSPHLKTIAQYLQKSNYLTAGFTGGAGVSSKSNFNNGFDIYKDDKDFAGLETTSTQALDWLKNTAKKTEDNHFLFLHGYDVHGQYADNDKVELNFSKSYEGDLTGTTKEHIELRDQYQNKSQLFLNEKDKQFLTNRYDDKIVAMDKRLEEFLSSYKKLKFKNPTIFIITSDHGEELFDHGGIDHGLTLYQDVVKTPLIIQLPKQKQQIKIETNTSSIDLLPTILELIKITPDENIEIDGTSFLPIINGSKKSKPILFHSDYRHVSTLRGGIDKNNNKIIFDLANDKQELYNLNKDSQEKNNLYLKDDFKNHSTTKWLKEFFWELSL